MFFVVQRQQCPENWRWASGRLGQTASPGVLPGFDCRPDQNIIPLADLDRTDGLGVAMNATLKDAI
jgi:hypothetical protein